jgi:prephenate dehydrogenase
MKWINESNVLIVGLGLMGVSYAMALRRLGYHVEANDTDKSAIDYAKAHGIMTQDKHVEGKAVKKPTLSFCAVSGVYKNG